MRRTTDRSSRHEWVHGLSIKELAGQLGVDEGTVAKWENGEREPAGNRMEIVEAFLRSYG